MDGQKMQHIDQAEIRDALDGLGYPVSLSRIIIHAAEKGTRDKVLQIMEKLPTKEYQSEDEVLRAVGELPENGFGGSTPDSCAF